MKTLVVALIMLAVVQAGFADTIYFKDGSTVNGKLQESSADTVKLQIGRGVVSFPAADVDRVEKNHKMGDPVALVTKKGKEHQDRLNARTGLTRQQRDEVRAAIEPLWSANEGERAAGRARLLELSRQMPLFDFLEQSLRHAKGDVAPDLMRVLVQIDPQKSADLLTSYSMNPDPRVRTAALDLLAVEQNPEHVEILARALIDPDPQVQASAAGAVAAANCRAATPALIRNLRSPNPAVQNASSAALKTIWPSAKSNASVEQWETFWQNQAAAVPDAIDPKSLEPLVTDQELHEASSGHDE